MDLSEFLQIISIHSTTRVETQAIPIAPAFKEISIHSTTRVETLMQSRQNHIVTDFNPLHHEGGDSNTTQ